MKSEILIGLGGLVLSALTYFAGVQRTQKRLSNEEKSARVQRVLDKYMGFRKTNLTGGLDGLQKAGVAMLSSDKEIRELINQVIKHGERSPISGNEHLFENVDLKAFFDYAATNHVNFMFKKVEEVIVESNSKA